MTIESSIPSPQEHNNIILQPQSPEQQNITPNIAVKIQPQNENSTPLDSDRVKPANELKKYETLKTIAKVIKFIGISLALGGAIGAALFFSAPVIVPLIVTTVIFAACFIPTLNTNGKADGDAIGGCMGGAALGGIIGLFSGLKVGHMTWKPIVNFVYNSRIALAAGAIGGAITLAGSLLAGAGYAAENYCDKKITALKLRQEA